MNIDHVNIVVSDLPRSLAFYVGLLGMRVTFETDLTGAWIETVTGLSGVSARCVFCEPPEGGPRFELLEYLIPAGTPLSANSLACTPGLRHVALTVTDLAGWHTRLEAAGVDFVSAPVWVPFVVGGNGHKQLCYLRDPDGALIELAEYFPA